MSDSTSDLIITLSVIIGVLIIKLLPARIKWGWRAIIGMVCAIILSIIGHLIVKFLMQ